MHRVREWIEEAWGTGLAAAWEFEKEQRVQLGKAGHLKVHSSFSSFLNPTPLFALSHNFLSFYFSLFILAFFFPPFSLFRHLSSSPSGIMRIQSPIKEKWMAE